MTPLPRPLAIVTGASSGIGYELAICCAHFGFDLVIAANEPEIHAAANEIALIGTHVHAIEADLSTEDGVNRVVEATANRPVEALLANAGRGLGRGFLDQKPAAWQNIINTNITGTLDLVQKIAVKMRRRGAGKILITGSIAGFMPGTYQAVYYASKAFLDSFSFALRHELKESGVTVTCLMPGATETEFFERADMVDTKLGSSKKDDPADVAQMGFEAMMKGEGEVIVGWMNKMRAAMHSVLPADVTADMHAKLAAPGTVRRSAA